MWFGIVSLVVTSVFGAVGYVWKRRFERRAEHETIAIEQARLKFLTEASAVIEKLDPAARDRATPMLEAALQNSLRTLSAPPERPGSAKPIAAARTSRPSHQLTAGTVPTPETLTARRKTLEEILEEGRESDRKYEAERRESAKRDKEFWVEMYRKPLGDIATYLIVYTSLAARQHAAELDLQTFNADRAMFDYAVFHARMAQKDDAEKTAKLDDIIKKAEEDFKVLLDGLSSALKERRKLKPANDAAALPPATDAKNAPSPSLPSETGSPPAEPSPDDDEKA
jgi:hypothetical protein